jgi:imidazolonepropionase-like amidohydrolase/lysophospholipase L1-like esterase
MRTRLDLLAGALALVAMGAARLPAQRAPLTALRFGAMADATGRTTKDAVIVVQADTIVSVGTGDGAVPAGARVIDLRGYTAIPGLIDVHTHMTYWRDKSNLSATPPRSKDSVVMAAAANALATLATGVTTVRDLGASNYADIAMRDSIAKGAMIGPRMFVAGYGLQKLTAPPRAGSPPGPPRGRVQDTLEIKEAIKAQVDAGADWIKMYGSTGSFQNVTSVQTFSDEEMRVAAETAHRYGKPIAIHSYGESGGRAAMRAGAESVEHPASMDDATISEWVKRGTVYVPTIDHNRFYAENAALLGYDAKQVAELDSFRLLNLETTRRANRAGMKIAMGSDAVYWMFGENTRELGWMVKAGMTPAQAIATATTIPAEMLRQPNKLGRIAPGYFADIVAVEGDPLRDIGVVIDHVTWVMKGGAVVVDRRGVVTPKPSAAPPNAFETEIAQYEAADRARMPAPGGVLFVGSSSIRLWTSLATDFPTVATINRGFGGSELSDAVYFADRIVTPYRPRLIVLYAGDNDLAAGKTPARVLADFQAFVARVRRTLPATPITFISIKPSIARLALTDQIRETNRLVRDYVKTDGTLRYVDVFSAMLDANGQPRRELYREDGLHMTPAGYALWRDALAPTLR